MTNRAERKARDSSLCIDALTGRCVKQRPDSCGGEQSPWFAASYLMVARDRIELPTRGFSVRHILHPASPQSIQYKHLGSSGLAVGAGKVTLGEHGLGTEVETLRSRCGLPIFV
jgi:hypothetical protein